MSYVIATPELMTAAAADLATIGSNLNAAHITAAAPTGAVIPAAADEVSASIAHLFSAHAQEYQALAGRAAAFHAQFVQNLTASAVSYASAEAANVSSLQSLLGYLLGGFGQPGLLPQIAVQIGVILEDVDPFPAVLRLINSLPLGPLTPPLLNLVSDLDTLFLDLLTL